MSRNKRNSLYLGVAFGLTLLSLPLWAQERPPIAGIYGGLGQDGSGSLMADYYPWYGKRWYEKARISAQIWTGGTTNENQTVSTTVASGDFCCHEQPTTTTVNNTVGSTQNTGNMAIGGAWCPTFGPFFACVGLAFLTNADTPNVDQHMQGNLALGGEYKGWRIFGQHYSDGHSGSSENFLMAGKQFSIK